MAINYTPPSPSSDFLAKETQTNQESKQREPARNKTPTEVSYKTKMIQFCGETKIIVLQDTNGPCPLIAIWCLLKHVASVLFKDNTPKDEKHFADAIEHLSCLADGLFVDLKFTGIYDIKYTAKLAAFDELKIPLCHGWLVDFEDLKTPAAFRGRTYNALQAELAAFEEQTDNTQGKNTNGLTLQEGKAIQQFFDDNSSQLTWHGLSCLKRDLKEGELCVLFRNNHFHTMLKHGNELFTLVTDQGFQIEQDVVWETLNHEFANYVLVVLVEEKMSLAIFKVS